MEIRQDKHTQPTLQSTNQSFNPSTNQSINPFGHVCTQYIDINISNLAMYRCKIHQPHHLPTTAVPSFRSVGPVVIHLTASGDLERLGKSFAWLGVDFSGGIGGMVGVGYGKGYAK